MHLFDQKCSKQYFCEILLQFKIIVLYLSYYILNVTFTFHSKDELSASLLQSSVCHSNIGAQEAFLIIINAENSCAA